jgi:hypothetical protein
VRRRLADTEFATLKDFQRRTVDHALHRLYDADDSTRRFLVADEVGMGKTLVARGVIAGAIERLDDERAVNRIDILYICSNAEIARQNIAKLDVFDSGTKPMNTRITMLAAHAEELQRATDDGHKLVNLISFTPGTSFEKGSFGGKVRERALLHQMLLPEFAERRRAERHALARVLRLGVAERTWSYALSRIPPLEHPISVEIRDRFVRSLRGTPTWATLEELVERAVGRSTIRQDYHRRGYRLIGELRNRLAHESVWALEPDLVILDEFQRFKHLLEPQAEGTAEAEVNSLAQELFNYPDVRVLLLSATPYKLFTLSDERAITGDDHYADFLATARFLLRDDLEALSEIERSFRDYRRALTTGQNVDECRLRVQDRLVRVMSRTERPAMGEANMLDERDRLIDPPTADELVGYVAMDRIAQSVDAPMSIDYWKSAPYFLNFMDGYKVGRAVKAQCEEGERPDLAGAPLIKRQSVRQRQRIDPANARLRRLQDETVGTGMWKLLWLPPSMQYVQPSGVFAEVDPATTTKRLIFSSWAAAPSSIAALLSHEANRNLLGAAQPDEPTTTLQRFRYTVTSGRPEGMTTLALFTPIPTLAQMTDPLDVARAQPSDLVSRDSLLDVTTAAVAPHIPPAGRAASNLSPDTWYWAAPFQLLEGTSIAEALGRAAIGDDDETRDGDGRTAHLIRADGARSEPLGSQPADLQRWVALLGAAGPGNVAWRALRRATAATSPSETTLLQSAAIIADGFRSLFNRPESMALLDHLPGAKQRAYWQNVLDYCLDGDLQAALDEYLHHLVGNTSPSTDEEVLDLARHVRAVLALRTSPVNAFDPRRPGSPIVINTRFALRYGSAKGTVRTDESSAQRMAGVQAAFNSPFWPMVLASTSVGQEGVDFHWWCHSLVHWNLPSNPVDFEQREGRVHRFKGHAVRKNVAAAFRAEALASDGADPWIAAFDAAHEARPAEIASRLGDLWPWWVYPGETKIERWIPCLPFSKDFDRDERLRRLRGIYRLAFGQPRQEELLDLFDSATADFTPLDLRPPPLAK